MKIQLLKPHIHQDAKDEVLKVLDTGWIGLGPKVAEFEDECKKIIKCKHAVAFNSATAALQAAITIADLEVGTHVITTPNTFVSTNHVILQNGNRPLFADIEGDTGNISVPSIKRLLVNRSFRDDVSALMVVHYQGQPVDLDEIYDLGLPVIEDAAHAFGASYKNRMIGERGRYVCFSFHAVKPLGIGDGGLLATDSADVAETARRLRWLGIDKSTTDRHKQGGYKWDYNVTEVGFKSHMNDIQAAIGVGQIKHFKEDKRKREVLVTLYRLNLEDVKVAKPLRMKGDRESANHLMVILAEDPRAKAGIIENLVAADIEYGCHYKPNTSYPVYNGYYQDQGNINMMFFYNTAITLPLHTEMSIGDVMRVCEVVGKEQLYYS